MGTREKDKDVAIYPQGVDGYVLRVSEVLTDTANRRAQALAKRLRGAELELVEVAPSLTSVYVRFDPQRIDRASLVEDLRKIVSEPIDASETARRLWTIPTCFEGAAAPQLAEAAGLAGLTEAEAVASICAAELRVLAIGFAPGQPYIGLLPEVWDLPRQTALTDEVPAGALTVAVRQLVLFANRSATGWRQVGRTAFRCFDAGAEVPVALRPGDGIRFTSVPWVEFEPLLSDPAGGARLET